MDKTVLLKIKEIIGKVNWKILIAAMVLIFIGAGSAFLLYQTVNAKPGDFMFFPKVLLERAQVDPKSYDQNVKVIEDRIKAIKQLRLEGNCVQLVVAEAELIEKLQQFVKSKLVFELREEDRQKILKLLDSIIKITNCEARIPYSGIKLFLKQINPSQVQLNLELEGLKTEVAELSGDYSHGFELDQEILNQISDLLLMAKTELTVLSPEPVTTFQIELIVDQTRQLLNKGEVATSNWKDAIVSICMLAKSKQPMCTSDELQGIFNSIEFGQGSKSSQLVQGREQYIKYLQAHFPELGGI